MSSKREYTRSAVEFRSESEGGRGPGQRPKQLLQVKTSPGCTVRPLEMLGQHATRIVHAVPMIMVAVPNDKHQAERFPEVHLAFSHRKPHMFAHYVVHH